MSSSITHILIGNKNNNYEFQYDAYHPQQWLYRGVSTRHPPGSRHPPPRADKPPTRPTPGADTPLGADNPRRTRLPHQTRTPLGADTPPMLTESQTPVKTLPCPKLRLRAVNTCKCTLNFKFSLPLSEDATDAVSKRCYLTPVFGSNAEAKVS